MIKFEKFTVRDIVFLAIMSTTILVVGMLAMPVMAVNIFGLRNMATAPIYALLCVIALLKVQKAGALTLVALFNGAILTMMAPIMLINNVVAAILAEIIALLIFKSYENKKAIFLSASLMIPLTLPTSYISGNILSSGKFIESLANPTWITFASIGTVLFAFVGGWLGLRIGMELKKAGKLR